MNKYRDCFNKAFNAYSQKDTNSDGQKTSCFSFLFSWFNNSYKARPGYQFGWFSYWRHGRTLYPHIAKLQENLQKADSDIAAEEVLHDYFKHSSTKFNNHSFAIYLLDTLLMNFPQEKEKWEKYYPPEKKLVFYTGELYRGMKIQEWQLNNIFKNGIESQELSKSIDDYARDTTMGLGISTSKQKAVALNYASAVVSRGIRETGKMIFISGYVLKINYRGQGGIDILPTLQTRGEGFNAYLCKSKAEVNIVGRIESSDIEGAWYVGQDAERKNKGFIKNENYMPNKINNENNLSFPQRLRQLFRKNKDFIKNEKYMPNKMSNVNDLSFTQSLRRLFN